MKNTPYHKVCAPYLALAASAALILAGCSKAESAIQDGRPELRLTSTIEMTRAGSANTQATRIVSGEKVTVWVSDSGVASADEASLYAVELTAQSDGTLTGDEKMYYPQTGNGVDISALHGDFTFTGGTIPSVKPEEVAFTVSGDQSRSGGAGYIGSDLLYAGRSAKRSSSAVNLEFYHLLSKLELNIGRSAEVTDAVASVTLDDVALAGTFKPGEVTDITSRDSRAAGISAGTATGGAIALGTSLSDANEAIVIPQDLAGKTLTFTLTSGGKLVYTFPESTTFESGRKYVYNVTLKLTELSVTSRIADWAVTDDADGDAVMPGLGSKSAAQARKGDFAMIDGTFVDKDATLTQDQIDGCTGIVFWTEEEKEIKAAALASNVTTTLSKDKLPTLADDKIMAEDFPDCTHGLIVALKNISSSMIWQEREGYGNCKSIYKDFQESSQTYGSSSKYKAVAPDFDIESRDDYDYTADPFNQILGYQNTKVALAFNAYVTEQGGSTVHIVQPVAALGSFEKENPSPYGSTGWYIPSIKELTLLTMGDFYGGCRDTYYSVNGLYNTWYLENYYGFLFNWRLGYNGTLWDYVTLSLVNPSLAKAGGDTFVAPASSSDASIHYRSSTEGHRWSKTTLGSETYKNNTYSLYFYVETDTDAGVNYDCTTIYTYGKTMATNVRAVCAF